jgi:hypothetical protein
MSQSQILWSSKQEWTKIPRKSTASKLAKSRKMERFSQSPQSCQKPVILMSFYAASLPDSLHLICCFQLCSLIVSCVGPLVLAFMSHFDASVVVVQSQLQQCGFYWLSLLGLVGEDSMPMLAYPTPVYLIRNPFLPVSSTLDWEFCEDNSFIPPPLSLYLLQRVGAQPMCQR